jgi:hypothetical protein
MHYGNGAPVEEMVASNAGFNPALFHAAMAYYARTRDGFAPSGCLDACGRPARSWIRRYLDEDSLNEAVICGLEQIAVHEGLANRAWYLLNYA